MQKEEEIEKEHLRGLNNMQKEAALHSDGPMLIIAGAGAGKTKTITHRIVNLIKNGVRPEKILAVTFTNKAAKEMKERIQKTIKDFGEYKPEEFFYETNKTPFISTFHSLGVYIIKENANLLGLNRHFTILDDGDTLSIIKEIIREMDLDPKQYEARKFKNIISKQKGDFLSPEEYKNTKNDSWSTLVARVWQEYENKKTKEGSLDFDDLLLKSLKLLKENENVKKHYQEKWQYVHIDEYQDTNELQYRMSKILAEGHQNICVVGDSDQCILAKTKIRMADGTEKNIEKIKKGEWVLSNYGGGKIDKSRVSDVYKKKYTGKIIKIKTKNGSTLFSTPEHMHFAGYKKNHTPQIYFNYLMYKKDFGFRIGTTSLHTKNKNGSQTGLAQRSNQEHSDMAWVIKTHKTEKESRVGEYTFSLKYQIPTTPFTPRKGGSVNGYVNDKDALKKIFNSLDTKKNGEKLLEDLGFDINYPHHIPQTSHKKRKNINITLCADKRGKTPMHLISVFGKDLKTKKILKSLGLSVRQSKTGLDSWRFETARKDYKEICLLAFKIKASVPEANLVFRARLGNNKHKPKEYTSLPFMPAGSLMNGMSLFTEKGYDQIEEISFIQVKNKYVFDLNIEKTHNFIANNIITHNCIYSWRGASIKNILGFEKDYKNAKIVFLEENYRSTQNILAVANEIIKKNKYRPEKNLFTKNKEGEKISIYEALDEKDEADFVATKILELLDQDKTKKEEIAVLYRANFQSRALEEAMIRYNIAYQVLGTKFFERKEIKDTLAYLRASLNPNSLSDIKRIINFPKRGLGKTTLLKLFANQTDSLPQKTREKINDFYAILTAIKEKIKSEKTSEIIKFIVKKSGIENELLNGDEEDKERLENIKELVTLSLKYDNLENGLGVEKLIEDASLASDQDSLSINEEKKEKLGVKLMTVHASKGLEFKYIFVVGLEEGLFPSQRDGETERKDPPASARSYGEAQEEERRLFYVAVTRAKEKLFLSFANFRTIFGSRQINAPSSFLLDIPEDFTEKEGQYRIKTIYI